MKIYFKTYVDDNGVYFKNTQHKILIRFAGNPQFLLEECIKTYGNKEGIRFYDKLTDLLVNISKRGFSPIVLYLYQNNDEKEENGKEKGETNTTDTESRGKANKKDGGKIQFKKKQVK